MTSAPALATASAVSQIRSFNRFYTRQIGLLNEHLLEGPFSLTETRVLYELAHRPRCTATALCQDLGLDAGYLSRMLRAFDKQGLKIELGVKVGEVKEKDTDTITADIVTKDKDALVQRFEVNRHTGFYRPEGS